MSMDSQLTRALHEEAGRQEAPPPELGSILVGGRRRHRVQQVRRAAVGVAAATALVAGASFVGTRLDNRAGEVIGNLEPVRPALVRSLSHGDPPGMPYCTGHGTIKGAGGTIRAGCASMVSRGGSTVAVSPAGIEQLVDGRRIVLDSRIESGWFPGMSADGRWVAWVAEEPSAPHDAVLLVFDLASHEKLAEVPWPALAGWTLGIDRRGRVYFNAFEPTRIWAYDIPNARLFEVTGLPEDSSAEIKFVTEDGFGVESTSFEATAETLSTALVGTVTDDGQFVDQHEVSQGWGYYSPDWSHFVQETREGFWVTATDGRTHVRLALPTEGNAVFAAFWETESTLLVQFDPLAPSGSPALLRTGHNEDPGTTYLLRCDATTGICEIALGPGYERGMDLSMYF